MLKLLDHNLLLLRVTQLLLDLADLVHVLDRTLVHEVQVLEPEELLRLV